MRVFRIVLRCVKGHGTGIETALNLKTWVELTSGWLDVHFAQPLRSSGWVSHHRPNPHDGNARKAKEVFHISSMKILQETSI